MRKILMIAESEMTHLRNLKFVYLRQRVVTAINFEISSIKISLFKTICGIDTDLALVRPLHTHACDSDWHVKIEKVPKKIADVDKLGQSKSQTLQAYVNTL